MKFPMRPAMHMIAVLVVAPPPLSAQDQCRQPRCVTLAPAARYQASGVHRVLFGTRHRDLWSIPVDVEVLDLSTFAGGLSPLRRGGGGQTMSLHLRGADGRRYVFRSVDKDATQGLPAELAKTFVDGVAQDQISALHPYAALVVAPLLEAAGVLHAVPRLVVMPDDPRLETYREDFGGLLGAIEERPEGGPDGMPGFAGATTVLGTEDLFDRLASGPETSVDARAFLTARLLDVYLGDRDRHRDQWRWALVEESWLPIPRDRDQAFVGLDGLLVALARIYQPALTHFDKNYPSLSAATYSGWALDRRLLSGLDRGVWDSVAVRLQLRLTDSVIEHAVRRMPPEAFTVGGAWLVEGLIRRRDGLREMAAQYYDVLASEPDVHATDADEFAQVRRRTDGAVEIRIYPSRTGGDGSPYFQRTFLPHETKEVRLFMHGGDDRVIVRGSVDRGILVRVIGGAGNDEMIDSSTVRGGKPTIFYDGHEDRIDLGSSARMGHQARPESDVWERFTPPPPPSPTSRQPQNWGGFRVPQLWLSGGSDLGMLVGGGIIYYKYGFRHVPYRYRVDFRGAYATGARTGRAEFNIRAPQIGGQIGGSLHIRASGIEILRFYGLGNGTANDPPAGVTRAEFFEVDQQELVVAPSLSVSVGADVRLVGGPFFKLVHTENNPRTLLAVRLPEEPGRTRKHLGWVVGVHADTRDVPLAAARGFVFSVDGTYNAGLFDGLDDYGRVRGRLATYLTPGRGAAAPTMALRLSAEKLWGNFPFYDASMLGGAETLRGYDRERFAGSAAVLGNAELRLPVGRHRLLLPGRFGVFGLADVGRVFFEEDTSDKLHTAVGGGISVSFLGRGNTANVAVTRSSEGVRLYARGGFLF